MIFKAGRGVIGATRDTNGRWHGGCSDKNRAETSFNYFGKCGRKTARVTPNYAVLSYYQLVIRICFHLGFTMPSDSAGTIFVVLLPDGIAFGTP